MRIHIANDYYIEVSDKNYALIEEYEGKTKDGSPRKGRRIKGYFNTLQGAVLKCLELNTLNGAKAVELWEYAKMVEESNKTCAERLGKRIEALLEKEELEK